MRSICCCQPCTSATPEELEHQQYLEDYREHKKTQKLLLLGIAESGKSTILRQLTILHTKTGLGGIRERKEKVADIKRNIRDSITAIVNAMDSLNPQVPLGNRKNLQHLERIKTQQSVDEDSFDYNDTFFDAVISLWKDPGVQECFQRSSEYQLIDSAKYFLDMVSDVRKTDYTPTEQDILRCRVQTTGIFETVFEMDKVKFHLFDVGGQRDERRKWIQCFNDVTAIIFVSASAAYDKFVTEDPTQNRLKESLELFKSVWNNRWLKTTSIILFLNKKDLLVDKIRAGRSKLETHFPEFASYEIPAEAQFDPSESSEVVRAKYFIRAEFLKLATTVECRTLRGTYRSIVPKIMTDDHLNAPGQNSLTTTSRSKMFPPTNEGHRYLYSHFTCALDPNNIRRVFNNCKNIVQRIYLEQTLLF